MLAALTCQGHVLFEDVPGHGQDRARTRDRAVGRGRDAVAHPVHAGPPADRRHRPVDLRPAGRATSSSAPGPIFANVVLVDEINRAMPKTQSALLEAMAEQPGDRRRRHPHAARPVPRCSRPRTRSSTRAPSRCPRRSSTASSSRPRSAIRAPTTSCEIIHDQRARPPARPAGAGVTLDEVRALQARGGGGLRRRDDPALDRRARARDPAARERRDRRLRPRHARARAGGTGLGAAERPRLRRAGGRASRSSSRCSGTASSSRRPSSPRRASSAASGRWTDFRDAASSRAPKPEARLGGEVLPLESPPH